MREMGLVFAFRKAKGQIFTVLTCGESISTPLNFLQFFNLSEKFHISLVPVHVKPLTSLGVVPREQSFFYHGC